MRAIQLATACVLSFLTVTGSLRAGVIAVTEPTSYNTFSWNFGTLGYEFTVNSDITVSHLGVFDDGGDGLTSTRPVGIWDSSGNLQGSAIVSSGTTATLQDGYRLALLGTPILLDAGSEYRIGALYTGPSELIAQDAVGFTVDPAITLGVGGKFNTGSPTELTFPEAYSTDKEFKYLGPSFVFDETAAVPEPTSLTLFALGAMGMVGYRWRRKRQAA